MKVVRKQSRITRTVVLLRIFFVLSASSTLALDPTSQISQYGHSVWRVQDGYFGGRVLHIAQTTDGYIWVGTDAGLYKFDGLHFARWSSRSGEELPSQRIMTLMGARDRTLWIGTDGGLAHLANNRLTVYEKGERWWISDVMEDRDGRIWLDHHRPDDDFHPLCQVVDNGVRCYGKDDGVEAEGGGPVVQDAAGQDAPESLARSTWEKLSPEPSQVNLVRIVGRRARNILLRPKTAYAQKNDCRTFVRAAVMC